MAFAFKENGGPVASGQKRSDVSAEGKSASEHAPSAQFIGKDHRILAVLDMVAEVADTDATVLITGESGTGRARAATLPAEVHPKQQASPVGQHANFHEAKAKTVEAFEKAYLTSLLSSCGGIVSRAAHHSGLSERNFHEKLKKYGICGKAFRF